MKFNLQRLDQFNPSSDKGFALVATLMLMILLVIISVGLLSLSTVSLRNSSHNSAQLQALANARMALMIAIGELQKEMGPDMRISAKAGILDNTPTTEVIDGVANPHYLGVWDSWNTWLTDRKGPLSIQDTYKPGRDPSLFRRWLVSQRTIRWRSQIHLLQKRSCCVDLVPLAQIIPITSQPLAFR